MEKLFKSIAFFQSYDVKCTPTIFLVHSVQLIVLDSMLVFDTQVLRVLVHPHCYSQLMVTCHAMNCAHVQSHMSQYVYVISL